MSLISPHKPKGEGQFLNDVVGDTYRNESVFRYFFWSMYTEGELMVGIDYQDFISKGKRQDFYSVFNYPSTKSQSMI